MCPILDTVARVYIRVVLEYRSRTDGGTQGPLTSRRPLGWHSALMSVLQLTNCEYRFGRRAQTSKYRME